MKFDASRVIAQVESLLPLRGAGPDAQDGLVHWFEESLPSQSWEVRHLGVRAAPRRVWPMFEGTSERVGIPLIVARPQSRTRAPARVVLLAPVAPRLSRGNGQDSAGARSLAFETQDLAGPAMIVELLRSWSRHRMERIEPVATIAAGRSRDLAGAGPALEHWIQDQDSRPTLYLVVYSPGMGSELIVDGFPSVHRGLAQEAARGLWIPMRLLSRNPFAAERRRWPLKAILPEQVTLVGSIALTSPEAAHASGTIEIDAAALGRAEQLASEIILRWARRHEAPPRPE